MEKTLKQKAISGMIWNGAEHFGSSFFLFVSNLVLARLLLPEDFGAIGILMVFISLSQSIVDGGFGSALIQKREPTQTDYSTVFFWNIALSMLFYTILYFSAPIIAGFYKMPILENLFRVLGIVLILNNLFLVQNNQLRKGVNFKKIASINLIAIVIGTFSGIIAAYYDCGVWSLIIKTILTSIIQCVLFWIYGKWRPTFIFSWTSFESLFSFGSFMFLNSIVNSLYHNLLTLIIGKAFAFGTLGYFTQARKLEDVPRSTIASAINNVSLPILSELQYDQIKLKKAVRKISRGIAFINFPIMMIMFIIAKPLILILFTEKWSSSIPLFQVLCVHGLIFFMFELNTQVLAAKGKSKLLFKIRLFQLIFGVSFVLIGSTYNIQYVVVAYTFAAYITYFFIAYYTKKIINYSLIEQLSDLLPYAMISLISALCVYLISCLNLSSTHLSILIIYSMSYFSIYILLSKVFNIEELSTIRSKLSY